ncbi:MAG: hypothetical protein HC853_01365 [Anaerolineae bacterium]|nr:hypothetical protein [Anaerolineae bacterium]
MQAIAKAARRVGVRPYAYAIQQMSDIGKLKLPAIARWESNHLVVIEDWAPGQVQIIDPAVGRRKVSLQDLNLAVTDTALTFEPSELLETKTDEQNRWNATTVVLLARQFSISAEGRSMLPEIALASILLQLSTFAVIWLTQIVVDSTLVAVNTQALVLAGVGALALVSCASFARWLRGWQMARLHSRIDKSAMHSFMAHLLSLPFQYFQKRTKGDLLNRLNSNINVPQSVTGQTLSALLDGSLALGFLLTLVLFAPGIAALTVGGATLQILIAKFTLPRLRELSQQSMASHAKTDSYEIEMLNGMLALKSSGTTQNVYRHWSKLFTHSLNIDYTKHKFANFTAAVTDSLSTLVRIALLAVGGWLVLSGQFSFGQMLAITMLANAFISPLNSLVSNIQNLQIADMYLDDVRNVLETDPEPSGNLTPNLHGPIEFVNVSFRYDATSPRPATTSTRRSSAPSTSRTSRSSAPSARTWRPAARATSAWACPRSRSTATW